MKQNELKEGSCLGCGSELPAPFLDLGKTPLANSLLIPEKMGDPEPVYPLAVAFCPQCHLVQLKERVPPELMFNEYLYFSSFSESFLAHAKKMAGGLARRFGLGSRSRVLEIASNDGYLLKFFQQLGIPVLGIEPARNIAEEAEKSGIPTLNKFFGEEVVPEIKDKYGRSDLIIGNNVLAHVPFINPFLNAVRECLGPEGTAVFEFPHLKGLLEQRQFDTIYHEHVFYYSLSALKNLAERNGLMVWDVERETVHGGSLRVFLRHFSEDESSPGVRAMLEAEEEEGLTRAERFGEFSQEVEQLKKELLSLLNNLKSSGKRLAAYGAPAKGNTLLNFCGVGADLIEFTVDRSPHKQGRLLPGSRIPIEHPDQILNRMPDYVLILPWNLSDEIIGQQKEFQEKGGKFIIPIPTPKII